MKTRMLEFVAEHALIAEGEKVLVALSGGRDSVALIHLLHSCGYAVGAAHVNYMLRGDDSVQDEAFAHKVAADIDIPFHCKVAWDKKPEGNIQELARRVRYDYFEELCASHGYERVATAHHADDALETMFINLLRGTGIKGMKGIPVKRDKIIRPLLWAGRDNINAYVQEHKLPFREDESNAGNAYLRNRIRHALLPLLTELVPDAHSKLEASMQMLGRDSEAMEQMARMFIRVIDGVSVIDLAQFPPESRDTWLYHCISHFGFKRTQCKDLLRAKEAGKRIESDAYIAVLNKGLVEVNAQLLDEIPPLKITGPGRFDNGKFRLEVKAGYALDNVFSEGNDVVSLDARSLSFPLTLRQTQAEDRFTPLGMDYEVKLNDYLRDKGRGPAQRQLTMVLETAEGSIAWVPGLQIADWCKIVTTTSNILCLSFERNGN